MLASSTTWTSRGRYSRDAVSTCQAKTLYFCLTQQFYSRSLPFRRSLPSKARLADRRGLKSQVTVYQTCPRHTRSMISLATRVGSGTSGTRSVSDIAYPWQRRKAQVHCNVDEIPKNSCLRRRLRENNRTRHIFMS